MNPLIGSIGAAVFKDLFGGVFDIFRLSKGGKVYDLLFAVALLVCTLLAAKWGFIDRTSVEEVIGGGLVLLVGKNYGRRRVEREVNNKKAVPKMRLP
jgi:hypothetical protein